MRIAIANRQDGSDVGALTGGIEHIVFAMDMQAPFWRILATEMLSGPRSCPPPPAQKPGCASQEG